MAEISDIMTAIDSFLTKKGKGDSYLVKKITSLFEGEDAPFDSEKGILSEFRKKIKKLNDSVEKFTENSNNFSKKIKIFNSVFTDNFLKNLRAFRDNLKISVLHDFFENIKHVNKNLKKINRINFNINNKPVNKNQQQNFSNKESVIKTKKILDVRIIEISKDVTNNIVNKLSSLFSQKINYTKEEIPTKKEDSGIISNIIKTILGVSAFFSGVGFISKFLNETEIGKIIKEKFGEFKDNALTIIKPFLKGMMEFMMEGVKTVFVEFPKYFLKSTFNFFGLKQMLGKENEGLSVLLTKGIYYSVKNLFTKSLNGFTFGLTGKLSVISKNLFSIFGDKLIKTGSQLMESVTSIMGSGQSTTKLLSNITKIGKGGIFKLVGSSLKIIGKRIPIIGTLISFKDAYDRFQKGDTIGGFISIGSGIATIFPGIGTAISIGLDILNAVLDYSDSGSHFKNMVNNNVVVKAVGDVINGTINFIKDILNWVSPVSWAKNIWSWLKNTKANVEKNIQNHSGGSDFEKKSDYGTRYDIPLKRTSDIRYDAPLKKVNDARVNDKNIIIPNNKDDVIMAKNGGPFDKAFKDMNNKLELLTNVFVEGVQLIASANASGSSNIVQAVISTGSNKQAPVIINNSDPIHNFRMRAYNAVESVR